MNDEADRKAFSLMSWVLGLVAGMAILGALVAAYAIGRNNAPDATTVAAEKPATEEPKGGKTAPEETTTPEEPTSPADAEGAKLFTASCASCHTLSAAGATGTTGPNLDDLQPDAATVEQAIANGGSGSGLMPANLYSGAEAQQVAEYVASSAGG